jgi:O-succinylhomoserine sulfhydrylase
VKFSTRLLTFDPAPGDRFTPANTPIYQTATFRQEDATEFGEYDYSRSGNPTRAVVEKQIAALEGGNRGFCFSTGLAAITAVTRLVSPGEEILACDDLYGGTYRLFSRILAKRGINVRYVDFSNLDAVAAAIATNTKLVYLETPTNPLLQIIDIAAVADIGHEAGATLVVDNVFATPLFQSPLALGADCVVYSATKHIDGQGRCLGGIILASEAFIQKHVHVLLRQTGPSLSPFNAWVMLKGLETLAVRVRRQAESASALSAALAEHRKVTRLIYPGRPDHPQAKVAQKQMRGGSTLVAFEVEGGKKGAFRFQDALKLVRISNNLGDAKSLITHPATTTHQRLTPAQRGELGISEGLLRLSVGLEHPDDIIEDVLTALEAV